MMPHGRRFVLLLVRRAGHTAATLRVPHWSTNIGLAAMFAVLMAGGGVLGWHLHGRFGAMGSTARWDEHGLPEYWSRFVTYKRDKGGASLPFDPRRAADRARRLGLGTRSTASSLLRGEVKAGWQAEADQLPVKRPGRLNWPVPSGWFVRGYGSGTDGYHLAVDIAAPVGAPVAAAAAGLVGYASDGVRGYGNIVLLIHRNGGVTMYAHNRRNLVVPGQRVLRGQTIAEVGNTGISRGPHVHFEFMRDGLSCDPLPLFRPGVPHRSGRLSTVRPAVWDGDRRPREIACARRRRHPHSRWLASR